MYRLRQGNVIPLLAALALLVQTLLPFFALYQPPARMDAAQLASVFGEKILICSSQGFRFVTPEELAQSSQHEQTGPQYQCAVCYVSAHAQGIDPSAGVLAAASLSTPQAASLLAPDLHVPDETGWRARLTRSPPISFVTHA